jgi:hypothetical protein
VTNVMELGTKKVRKNKKSSKARMDRSGEGKIK